MRRRTRAAFDQNPSAERYQFRSYFRDDCHTSFVGSGLPEDTQDDWHARYLPKR